MACATDLGRPERIGRRDVCPSCGVELHSCRQCRLYEPALANGCREPQAERVLDKTRANFCDHFVPAEGRERESGPPGDRDSPRAALERLFRRP